MAANKIPRHALIDNPFRVWRTRNGLTLKQAIKAFAGVTSAEAWRKWERGDTPNDENLHQLAPIMGFGSAGNLLKAIDAWKENYGICNGD